MSYDTIEVRKVTPNIGAEIHGVNLAKALSNQQFDEIHRALLENLVIFFRDQAIDVDQQKDFGRRFGKLHIHPAAPKGLEQHPEILVIKADENSKRVAGEEWHSDVSCDPEPPMGSILHLTTVPPDGGGDTMFANMYLAYDTLSEPVRKLLEGLTAIHDGEHVFRGRYGVKDAGKLLFVNRGFTTRIAQLKRHESTAVLEMLYRHIETPELHCRFKWEKGSIAFWDNRCVQHHALWDYYPARRYGHRVTVCGDKPFYRA